MLELLNFLYSVVSMIDSNLANGPIYFNCYPRFSMNMHNPSILSSLTLNIKTKNMKIIKYPQTIAIVYRIYYKVMTTQLNPRPICQSVRGETLLLQNNPNSTQACRYHGPRPGTLSQPAQPKSVRPRKIQTS